MNKKKSQILEAAKELFSAKGFNDTSVADIIALANVSKGTFYNHFSSKNACMMAILQELHERTVSERKIIAHFNTPTDIHTLEKELSSQFTIIIESNIRDMMLSSLTNQEEHQEIHTMIKAKSVSELHWLGKRLIDIYGERAKNKAYDCAVMILGSLHQLSIIRSIFIAAKQNLEQDIKEILSMIEPIIFSNQASKPGLISEEVLLKEPLLNLSSDLSTYDEMILDFEVFYEEHNDKFNEENEAYTKILIDALKSQSDNRFLIESLAFSFIRSFHKSEVKLDAFKVYQQMERWLVDYLK